MAFNIKITPKARIDTLKGIEWYNEQSTGLGKRFYQDIQKQYKTLRQNPYFQIRYDDVRCLPLGRFPYMIHFVIEEENRQVVVLGVICTYRNPKIWKGKT